MVLLGSLLLGFTAHSAQAQRYAGDRSNYDNNTAPIYELDSTYTEECGACHLLYAPSLLPVQSWEKILGSLDDHFKENAELDAGSRQHLLQYLTENALGRGKIPLLEGLSRGLPTQPALRITELPQFKREHASSVRQLGGEVLPVGFFSPCEDCHKQAASGIFDKERIYKGYGPSFTIGEDPKLK